MKKIVSMMLILGMSISLAACGSSAGSSDASGEATASGTASAEASGEAAAEGAITSIDDLEGSTIGVQLGTTGDIYASDYEGDDAGTVVERFNKGADAVQALLAGKVDCVIIDENPAGEFVKVNETLSILEEPFADEEYAICISKDNSDLTEAFNGALAELKEEGIVDKIIANYIGDDTGSYEYETPEGTDHSNGTLIMATNAQFPPYEYYDDINAIVGIDVDIATAICDKLGYELEISDMEFDSIIAAVNSGKADFGMAGMTVTEDRLQNVDFTDTYTTTKQVIIVNQ